MSSRIWVFDTFKKENYLNKIFHFYRKNLVAPKGRKLWGFTYKKYLVSSFEIEIIDEIIFIPYGTPPTFKPTIFVLILPTLGLSNVLKKNLQVNTGDQTCEKKLKEVFLMSHFPQKIFTYLKLNLL